MNGSYDKFKSVELKAIQVPKFVHGQVVGGLRQGSWTLQSAGMASYLAGSSQVSTHEILLTHHQHYGLAGCQLDMKPLDHCIIPNVIDIDLQPKGFYQET